MAEDWELDARSGVKKVEDAPNEKAYLEGEVSSFPYTTVLDPTVHTVEEALNKLFTNVLPVHQLDGAAHSVSGLTPGHFLKALSATTFGFAAHGLTYTDVGAAAAAHVHSGSDITSGTLGIGVIPTGSTNLTVCIGNDSRLSDARTPAAHQLDGALHTVSGLTTGHFLKATGATTFGFVAHGLTYSDVGAAAASHVHAAGDVTSGTFDVARIPTGNTSSTVCIGNDARLSDSRTPTAHVLDSASHTVSGLTTGHVLQALSATTFGFAVIPTHASRHVVGATDTVFPAAPTGSAKYLKSGTDGTLSWDAGSSTVAWDAITAPSGSQALSMGTNTSTWTYTSGFAVRFEDGKVGIGTNSPSYLFTLKALVNTVPLAIIGSGSGGAYVYDTSGHMKLALSASGGTTNVNLDTNGVSYLNGGYVGIGTASPGAKLQVNCSDVDTSIVSIISGLGASPGHSYGLYIYAGTNSSDYPLEVYRASDNASLLRVRGDGHIGIGKSAPLTTLHIRAQTGEGGTYYWSEGNAAGDVSGLVLQTSNNYQWHIENRGTADAPNNRLDFWLYDGATVYANLMSLIPSGYLGIGKATPSYSLDVNGAVGLVGASGGTYTGNSGSNENYDLGLRVNIGGTVYKVILFGIIGNTTGNAGGNMDVHLSPV